MQPNFYLIPSLKCFTIEFVSCAITPEKNIPSVQAQWHQKKKRKRKSKSKSKSKKKDKKKDKKRKKVNEEDTGDTSNNGAKRQKKLTAEEHTTDQVESEPKPTISIPTPVSEEATSEKKNKKKKSKKKDKKSKKEKKKRDDVETETDTNTKTKTEQGIKAKQIKAAPTKDDVKMVGGRVVSFSAQDMNKEKDTSQENSTTLLLFYQYIEPVLEEDVFQHLLNHVQTVGEEVGVTGRMRVSHEGLNCTLTGSYEGVRKWCKSLREYDSEGGAYFAETEFKLTDYLPSGQAFPRLHAFKVDEIVNYGLAGVKAPSVNMSGVHLEPKDYHKKMTEDETVIIDVRNHYEANIGKFQPPETGAQYIDPMMRKSTEFPLWLDRPETKEMLKGKQVLMYCTGGVRCERASALLRTKMENEEDTKALGIKGVYQLQGGIDKYFRDFPEGGLWKGKNYVFDKRFSHAPPVLESIEREGKKGEFENDQTIQIPQPMGRCEACQKPWDKYRGKRRCPTCGVPSLICKECHDADANKTHRLDRSIRCDLCIKEGITSKRQIREMEEKEMEQYEQKLREVYGFELPKKKKKGSQQMPERRKIRSAPNPKKITKLFIKNLCSKQVDQPQLCELFPGITHIDWIMDRKTGNWYGSVNVEMDTPENAALAVGSLNKQRAYGRVVNVHYSEPDSKSIWPHPNHKI